MAVIVVGNVPGQTKEGYDQTIAVLGEPTRKAPGFILHVAHPIDGGWRVIEVWESSKAAAEWFAKMIKPNIPPGIHPHREVIELHTCIRP